MAKKKSAKKPKNNDELSLEESLLAVKRIAKSNKLNEELDLLKQASATLAKELQPEFEFEEDEGGAGGPSIKEDLTKPPGFFEQLGTTVQALGPAGLIALGSAAYFQIDTVVEETRYVSEVAEEKWEEVKFEHPNINWDDPLAGFTTILGVGDIEIDLEPPAPVEPEPKDLNESTTISEEPESGGEEESAEEETTENVKPADETTNDDSEEEPVEEEAEEEQPKKKKKGLFGLFGGDDEEGEEEQTEEEADEPEPDATDEPQEESEPEPEAEEQVEETEEESVDEESEESETVEEESSEPEPEAEEQVEEKPKKKGGLFSFLTGGDDEEADEQGEDTTTNDESPQTETTEETEAKPQAKTDDGETEIEVADEGDADVEQSSEKKSSGGLFAALFGNNDNTEEEVVEDSEVSIDNESGAILADSESGAEEAPPLSEEQPEIAPIDEIDDIKPHSDVMVAETDVEALPEIEVVATDSGESFEINLAEMSIDDLEFLSDAFDNGEIEVADISVDDTIEQVVEQVVIEKVITPINTGNGEVNVVSPEGPAGDLIWADIFGPSAPGYDTGDRDATPI